MLKSPVHNRNKVHLTDEEIAALYALKDFLEMRTSLTEKKISGFLTQIRLYLRLPGEIQSLPAFMVGKQAVLCTQETAPETYWIYNEVSEDLNPWKEYKSSDE